MNTKIQTTVMQVNGKLSQSRAVHVTLAIILSLAVVLSAGASPAFEAKDAPGVLVEPSMGLTVSYDPTQWVPTLLADNGAKAPDGVSQRAIGLANQNEKAWIILASFNNISKLTAGEWIQQYDYARTNAEVERNSGKIDGRDAVILTEAPKTYQGTPANMRAVVTANNRVYVFEYASMQLKADEFALFLSGIRFSEPKGFAPSVLSADLAKSFKEAGVGLKPSTSQPENAPLVQTCCNITDPEYNPFPCNIPLNRGNCTWWARYKRTGDNRANLHLCTGNANTWDECAVQHYPDLIRNIPRKSSVVVWMGPTENHVTFIEYMNDNGSHHVSQMGWNQICPYSEYNSTRKDKFIWYPKFNGGWYLRNSNTPGNADITFSYGSPADIPIVGDWNGDGVDTPGVFRAGQWLLRNSNTPGPPDIDFRYGNPTDIPLTGDWNGDGIDTPGVFRDGTWYLRNSNTSGNHDITFGYGDPTDVPFVGDWNSDRVDTPGVFRTGVWYLRNSNTPGIAENGFHYGIGSDVPIVGDWNNDGIDTPGVFRLGVWFLRNSNTPGNADITFHYGIDTDMPLTGDWNGDGIDTPAVTR